MGSTVEELCERLKAEAIEHEVIVINDHSTDATEDALN
jgi:glycosyltransferase involved in cell wall biosynthesis